MSKSYPGSNGKAQAEGIVRRRIAMSLRLKGYSYREIAEEMGLSVRAVHKHAQRAFDEVREETREEARQLLDMENIRLEELHRAFWERALTGNFPAADMILRTMSHRARINRLGAEAAGPDPSGAGNPYAAMSDAELLGAVAERLSPEARAGIVGCEDGA